MVSSKSQRIDAEWAALIPKGWGTWGDAKMHSGERRMLHDLIEDDEHLEALIGGHFGPDLQATGGPMDVMRHGSLHNGIGVATDRRVVFVDKGIFSSEVAEIPYASIESISYSTGVMRGGLKISARGTTSLQVENVPPKESAKAFADVVRPHLTAHLNSFSGAPVSSQVSYLDEIRKLGDLLQMGLITQEEFDATKSQLLGL